MRPISRSRARRYVSVKAGESRYPKSRRAGSWRRSDLTEVLTHCTHELRETCRTVGVREREIGRIRAMCLSIRPLRDPALTSRGRTGLVSNESADTTDGEQRRCDQQLSHRSRRRLVRALRPAAVRKGYRSPTRNYFHGDMCSQLIALSITRPLHQDATGRADEPDEASPPGDISDSLR